MHTNGKFMTCKLFKRSTVLNAACDFQTILGSQNIYYSSNFHNWLLLAKQCSLTSGLQMVLEYFLTCLRVNNLNTFEPKLFVLRYGITLVKLMDFRSDKKLEEARKHLQRAVELDPHDARSWQFLGLFSIYPEHSETTYANTFMILAGVRDKFCINAVNE